MLLFLFLDVHYVECLWQSESCYFACLIGDWHYWWCTAAMLIDHGVLTRNAILISYMDWIDDDCYHNIGRYCDDGYSLMDTYHCSEWCYLLSLKTGKYCPFLCYKSDWRSGSRNIEFNAQAITSGVRLFNPKIAVQSTDLSIKYMLTYILLYLNMCTHVCKHYTFYYS